MCEFESVTTIHGCGAVEHTESKAQQFETSWIKRTIKRMKGEPAAGDCQRSDCIHSTMHTSACREHSPACRDSRSIIYAFRYEPAQCEIDCKFHQDRTEPGYALAVTAIYEEIKDLIMAQATMTKDKRSIRQLRDEPM